MKIFVSWSGERSRAVANILKNWLPDLIEGLEVWTASKDIEAGQRWNTVIGSQLEAANFGILCVTPKNVVAPWLLFEAGALSKSLSASKVIPYLIELTPAELEGPLQQFQSVTADREGTLQLVRSILFTRDGNSNGEERLKRIFDSLWSRLEQSMKWLPNEEKGLSTHELVESCLALLKNQEQWRSGQQLQTAHARLLFEWTANFTHKKSNLTDSAKEAVNRWVKKRVELDEKIKPIREKLAHIQEQISMDEAISPGGVEIDIDSKKFRDVTFYEMGPIELEIEYADKRLIEELENLQSPKAG